MSTIERTLLIADLSGYTALTEAHGALHASEVVLRFNAMAETSIEPGVVIVDRIGDQVLCAGADTLAVLRSALRLCAAVEREADFLALQVGMHRGPVVERSGRLFGTPVNLTARLAAHARGGQILCTEPVAAEARAHPGLDIRGVGEKRFKNVPFAVHLYQLLPQGPPGQSSAIDPVCRMHVDPRGAATTVSYEGFTYHFCSAGCARLFEAAPERYPRLWG